MEWWTWLLVGLVVFLIAAAGIFIVFGFFAKAAPEAGGSIFSQLMDALFGRVG
ncbi:MAG: hypothetical protein QW548_03260 [Candidatus Aenigmatarchaeota archaeon]